jgi:hypothetical protein
MSSLSLPISLPSSALSSSSSSSSSSISLGDLLQKVSQKSYEELKILLESFPAQSLQLRGEKLSLILNKIKKRYAQLYALLNWLTEDHVRNYLSSTRELLNDVLDQSIRYHIKQDAFYYLHSSLYGQRIKSIEINEAYELILQQSDKKLPTSIENCQEKVIPELDLKENEIEKQLEIMIRSKLLLDEKLLVTFDKAMIKKGVLTLCRNHYFEIRLSLKELDDWTAPWSILSVNILTHNHENERLIGDSDPQEINTASMKMICKLIALPAELVPLPLTQIHQVLSYVSLSQALRILYVQALDMTRTSLIGIADAVYVETTEKISFLCPFWKQKQVETIEIGESATVPGAAVNSR